MLIYDKNTILKEENFQNNGLGYLTDFTSNPKITEELNGTKQLEFEYSINGQNAEYLENYYIIKAWHDTSYQLFYITKATRKRNRIAVFALHIAFLLNKNNLSNVQITNKTAISSVDQVLSSTDEPNYFDVVGDANAGGSSNFSFNNINPIAAILTDENSIINVLGGEIHYDNFEIGVYNQIGEDNNVTVLWGKNLKQFDQEIDATDIVTRVIPISKDGYTLPEKYVNSPLIDSYPFKMISTIEVDVELGEDETKTEEQLLSNLYEKMREIVYREFDNGLDKPKTTVTIDWQDLSKTEEYKN